MEIKVDQIGADRVFWLMLDENVDKIEDFYKSQLSHFTEKFHIMTLQAIRLVQRILGLAWLGCLDVLNLIGLF